MDAGPSKTILHSQLVELAELKLQFEVKVCQISLPRQCHIDAPHEWTRPPPNPCKSNMAAPVCQHVSTHMLLLISIIPTDTSGHVIIFRAGNSSLLVMAELIIWGPEPLLLLLPPPPPIYVVQVNVCQSSDGPRLGNKTTTGDWKRCMLSALTFLHQQKCYTCFFFFLYTHPAPQQLDGSWASSQHCFFHQQAYCTIKHFPQAQISADELISAAAAT